MDQLRRETQPPAGTPPSPVPQYWNPDEQQYERVLGANGAPRAVLYGPDGLPITADNRLPVDVTGEVSVAGDVSVTGEVSVAGDVSVTGEVSVAGDVDVTSDPNRALGKVTVAGSTVDRRGPASARPPASSVDVGTTYWSVDTGDVSVSTGSTWRSLGVA